MATSDVLPMQMHDITLCSLCRESFKKPKVLPCVHTFCLRCLENEFIDKNAKVEASCPVCSRVFLMPRKGVEGLPTSNFINHILEQKQRTIDAGKQETTMLKKKLVLVGDPPAGSISIVQALKTTRTPDCYASLRRSSCHLEVNVVIQTTYNVEMDLAIWIPCGGQDSERVRPLSYPETDVVIVCFSVVDLDSLKNIADKWLPEVKHFCPNVPIILVGSEIDLRSDENTLYGLAKVGQKPISQEEGNAKAREIGAYAYLECSSKATTGIREIFEEAARAAFYNHEKKSSRKCSLV